MTRKHNSCILSTLILILLMSQNSFAQLFKAKSANDPKEAIVALEKKFMDDMNEKGAEYAMHYYAADHAVIKRENDTLIVGRDAIKNYYSSNLYKNAKVEWAPDFVDLSADGTMAYTYGKYKWTLLDDAGIVTFHEGIFHTVWKKMSDGEWKYVWD